ncbi:MAG TPA: hypothetical protein DIW43_06745 [Spongiibacteraceae bacterium]|nr:hypothetical protein [Spongiibacteraceae bacterium]HCS27132.1 hypothetical protein [Spongiibacteraceae bacterium]|tara:strand:+ start:228 stop:914 length:687 start_codon:yes stop_codon:yes gene_type:complete
MSLPPRTRLLLAFLLANAVVLSVGALLLLNRPPSLPQIDGVFLPTARDIPPFEVLDQNGEKFINTDLKGKWHLVSYGFTSCPDICPTILSDLLVVADKLPEGEPLRFVFYSIDHRRDTPLQLARYLDYFSPSFIGLTHRDGNGGAHKAFEDGLGMVSELVVDEAGDANEYQVNHGVALFLLNPDAQLQAVFKPSESLVGKAGLQPDFNPETLVNDYLAIRRYVANNSR